METGSCDAGYLLSITFCAQTAYLAISKKYFQIFIFNQQLSKF